MKTLIVSAHPNIKNSVVNKAWLGEVGNYPDRFTIHDLYDRYPDGKIDVAREQALVESHGDVIFQFPIYWFNCPPLMKKWLDDVLTQGWAFHGGNAFKGRKVALAVSAGIAQKDYAPSGKWKHGLQELLAPFAVTFAYIGAEDKGLFAFYGAEDEVDAPDYAERLRKSGAAYVAFLASL